MCCVDVNAVTFAVYFKVGLQKHVLPNRVFFNSDKVINLS